MNEPTLPEPGPERHNSLGIEHDAVWVVTSCGHDGHPTWWSCSICFKDVEEVK